MISSIARHRHAHGDEQKGLVPDAMMKDRRNEGGCSRSTGWFLGVLALVSLGTAVYLHVHYSEELAKQAELLAEMQATARAQKADADVKAAADAEELSSAKAICARDQQRLADNAADLEQQLKAAVRTSSDRQSEVVQLQGSLQEQLSAKEAAEQSAAQVQSRADQLEGKLQEQSAAREASEKAAADSSARVQQLEQEKAEALAQVGNLEAAVSALRKENDAKEHEAKQLYKAKKAAEQQAEKCQSDLLKANSSRSKAAAADSAVNYLRQAAARRHASEGNPDSTNTHSGDTREKRPEAEQEAGGSAHADSTAEDLLPKAPAKERKWRPDCPDHPRNSEAAVACHPVSVDGKDLQNSLRRSLRASCSSNCLYSQAHPLTVAYVFNPAVMCYDIETKANASGNSCLQDADHEEFMQWIGDAVATAEGKGRNPVDAEDDDQQVNDEDQEEALHRLGGNAQDNDMPDEDQKLRSHEDKEVLVRAEEEHVMARGNDDIQRKQSRREGRLFGSNTHKALMGGGGLPLKY